jgi:uncharacterized membrane protein YhiD involved in acid resistance
VAAIGLKAGAGLLFEALGATITVMVVLEGLGWIERKYLRRRASDALEDGPVPEDRAALRERATDQHRRAADRPHRIDDE